MSSPTAGPYGRQRDNYNLK